MPRRKCIVLIVDEDDGLDQAADEEDTEGIASLPGNG